SCRRQGPRSTGESLPSAQGAGQERPALVVPAGQPAREALRPRSRRPTARRGFFSFADPLWLVLPALASGVPLLLREHLRPAAQGRHLHLAILGLDSKPDPP